MKKFPASRMKAVTIVANLPCDISGAVALLNGMVTGTGIDQRLGREVMLDWIEGHFESGVTASTGIDQYQRWLLVYDRQPNGAALTTSDVLDSVEPLSQLNLANSSRFSIIADRFFALNASAEPGSKKAFDIRFPLNKRVIFNAGTAGTVADITTGSLYLVTVGSVGAGVSAGSLRYSSRVVYHNVI